MPVEVDKNLYGNKAETVCEEFTYIKDSSGVRDIAYYECRIILDSKNDSSAMKIRIKPLKSYERYIIPKK